MTALAILSSGIVGCNGTSSQSSAPTSPNQKSSSNEPATVLQAPSRSEIPVAAVGTTTVQADGTYTTRDSNGKAIATFTQVGGPGSFGKAWKDPSGAIWSSYQGDFTNEAIKPDLNNVILDSPATEACAKIGGSLPSAQDYFNLMKNFEMNSYGDTLTDQGEKDLFAVFPDQAKNLGDAQYGRSFASSSLNPRAGNYAYYFGGYEGAPISGYYVRSFTYADSMYFLDSFDSRNDSFSVRCISR